MVRNGTFVVAYIGCFRKLQDILSSLLMNNYKWFLVLSSDSQIKINQSISFGMSSCCSLDLTLF
jgi:hypothetical protein